MAEYQDRDQNNAQQNWQQSSSGANGGQGGNGWNNGQGWNDGNGWNNGQGWNDGNGWNNGQGRNDGSGWNNGQGRNGGNAQDWDADGWSDRGGWNADRGSGRRLTKSASNRMVCGVCAGIGEDFNWDPTIVRLVWVGVSLLFGAGFMGLIAYFIVAVIMPER